MNSWGYWYFLTSRDGRVSRQSRYGKAEVVTLENFYVNKQATIWSDSLGENQEKPGGMVYIHPEKTKTETSLFFWVLG